jgi:3-deoxy-D-manno-octulosonic-acid transferase
VWLAASVREGEEGVIAGAFARLRATVPDCRLVLAPRHPEHARASAAALGARGIASRRRSAGIARIAPGDALVLDTLGEMLDFCAAADLAFVGGSLVPLGGHNLLEPAALGLPVVSGPHLDNVRETADALIKAGALTVVDEADELADALLNLLADPEARARARRAGLNVVTQNRGAVAAFAAALVPLLDRPGSPGAGVSQAR